MIKYNTQNLLINFIHNQKIIVFYEVRHLEAEPGSLRKKRNRLLSLIKEKLRGLAEFQVNGHPEKSYKSI